MSEFVKWRSINKFADAYKMAMKHRVTKVKLGTKIKLHGTNGGIRLTSDGMVAQKRTSDVFTDSDNAGFANWVATLGRKEVNIDYFRDIIVYGEWAGKGVQKTDAVSETPKTFYAFSLFNTKTGAYMNDPTVINAFLGKVFTDESLEKMRVVPWFEVIDFDFSNFNETQSVIDKLVAQVDEIAKTDPYIKTEWGVEGPGEGLVGYFEAMQAWDGTELDPEIRQDYLFKVKSEAHAVQKGPRNKVGIQKPEGVDEFITTFFTEQRFRQMLDEHLDGVADIKKTGVFMKAVMSDVHKESVNEIEAADFEWKIVPKFATQSVREWFLKESEKL